MKKIFYLFFIVGLLPLFSLAQNYGYRMENFNVPKCYGVGTWISAFFILLIPIIWFSLCIFAFIFWLLMLVDAIKNSPKEMKLIWVIVIVFTNIIGAFIYYFLEKKKGNNKSETKKEE